jgi:hypothetical protein
MKEYVLKIVERDKEHPLAETMLLEFGYSKDTPERFIEAFKQLTELLKVLKTPEKVAEFMRKNASLSCAKNLTLMEGK